MNKAFARRCAWRFVAGQRWQRLLPPALRADRRVAKLGALTDFVCTRTVTALMRAIRWDCPEKRLAP